MIELLIKKFVKNSEKTEDPKVRTGYITVSGICCIFCNLFLFAFKLTIGMLSASIAITAEAFNNLSDVASNVITLVGARLAGRPADAEHPFGHGRYEYIAGLVVSFIILEVGLTCFKDSFGRILHPVETAMSTPQFIILAALILVKVWMGVENGILGKKIDSPSLKATSADSFSDVLTSGATITALLIGTLTGFNIDGYMGVAVSVLILIAGVNIIKETLKPLIGTAASYEVYKKITDYVEGYEGIYGTHDLIVHNYGPSKLIATIHAEVDDTEDMVVAHELVDKIERNAMSDLGILLTIHMDPVAVNDERLKELKPLITKIVQKYEVKGSIHDLRMVNGNENINLIFDITLPHKHIYMEDELSELVAKEVKKIDPRYNCVIEVEHGFVNDMDS